MATIEPRLIHLLNDSTTPQSQIQHPDLPPLHALTLPTSSSSTTTTTTSTSSSDRPLPPIELEASHRADSAVFAAASNPLSSLIDDPTAAARREDGGRWAASHPLRMLLSYMDALDTASPHAHSIILNEPSDAFDDGWSKKRSVGGAKDDFVQLPQPLMKQMAAQQAPAVPPIINGLHEPPPHAAMFPPIAFGSYCDAEMGQPNLPPDFARESGDKANNAPPSSPDVERCGRKTRKRATKPRKKWTEEETRHLLLGVSRYGVGKWTSIIEDRDFTFNHRTPGDLKDRFRTCCPAELCEPSGVPKPTLPPPAASRRPTAGKARKGLHSENILIEEDAQPPADSQSPPHEAERPPKKKSRAHRKKVEDLAELGIHGPFKKSPRRERRPFSDQDDREILEGLDIYGPAWSKIQRDPRYHLSSRQPTDLRDRPPPPSTSGNQPISHSSSKEDLSSWPLQMLEYGHTPSPATFEFAELNGPHLLGGEMDIARLLLDESRLSQTPTRPYDAYSGSSSSSVAGTEHRRDRHRVHPVKC
ncbi:hypothetical protein RJ55_05984 [Drechmeria coniospora]|nr:hypothetical protein RJ55_05984 [Drechmeria coniospora]